MWGKQTEKECQKGGKEYEKDSLKKMKKIRKKVLTFRKACGIIVKRSRERPLRKRSKALDEGAQD